MRPDILDVVEASHTYEIVRSLRAAGAVSRTASGLGAVARWIRASGLYGWFTAEPDSQEIVIDLRRSYVVGPLLGLFARGLGPLKRVSADARRTGFVRGAVARPATLFGAWLLGVVLASLVRAWPVSDPFVLGAYGFAVCISGITFAVEDWSVAVWNSQTSTLVATASRLARATR